MLECSGHERVRGRGRPLGTPARPRAGEAGARPFTVDVNVCRGGESATDTRIALVEPERVR